MRSLLNVLRGGLTLPVLWFGLLLPSVVLSQQKRALTLDDLFKLEGVWGPIQIAPGGDVFAFQRRAPKSTNSGRDRWQVWVAPIANGPATKVSGEDSNSYVRPAWSPDGNRLAMLSLKADDTWILSDWERATRRVAILAERPIWGPFAWLDNSHLVAVMRAEGGSPVLEARKAAMREWQRQMEGHTPTVNVLESGVGDDIMKFPQLEVVLVDANSGACRTLDRSPAFEDLRVSPDGHYVAFLKQVGVVSPEPALPLPDNDRIYRLVIADATGSIVSTEKSPVESVLLDSFQWSQDGRSFAFLGKTNASEKLVRLFRGTVGGRVEVVPLPDSIEVRKLMWAAGDRLLVAGEQELGSGNPRPRLDWWVMTGNSALRNLTEKLVSAPNDLLAVSDGNAVVGIANGEVWRLDIESYQWKNLTAEFEPKVDRISWPEAQAVRGQPPRTIVVAGAKGDAVEFYRIDTLSGSISRLVRPSDSAKLVAYDSASEVAMFYAKESTGMFLTTVKGEAVRSVIEMNGFLRDIDFGNSRPITYKSLDGKDLTGWIILPANYNPGKQYPLVTWVYVGNVYGKTPPQLVDIDAGTGNHQFNLHLLAARGYAVLIPSMPLPPPPDGAKSLPSDPYLELSKGVLPAIDKAIELGIADPQRLAVYGHSFGGYSTMGLIEQTNRFRAAVASAGVSDLGSHYGSFRAGSRYDPHPDFYSELSPWLYWTEIGGRMGGPLWKDLGRYIRNSPISYVDRVQTPLLIIHNDMDMVSVTQSEQFFSSLKRQGKRARFVQYWGEGHLMGSPANLRDYWLQLYAWLDEFCDISRDAKGNVVFEGDRVKSRNGGPPLKPEDFARFDAIILKESISTKETSKQEP